MNREALLKELRALLDSIQVYKNLSAEARTAEVREKNDATMKRIKEVEKDLADLDEIEAIEARSNTPINGEPPTGQISIEDQPIYRGNAALGRQMIDIAILTTPNSDGYAEARSRFDSMVKREKSLAEKRAAGTGGMVMATGQDGGLLLQGETSMDMLKNGFNNSEVLSRAANRDLGNSQFVELVGLDETSRADGSRGGGVRVYSDKELALMTQSKTKFDKIRLEPKRLTGMYFASDEILSNAPMLTGEMTELFNEEFAYKGQDLALNGSGAGEALGVMKAPCLVTVAAEAGQAAGTLLFNNLIKMKARMRRRSRRSLLWVANQDIEPSLYTLTLPIGTGGALMPAYIPSNNPADGVELPTGEDYVSTYLPVTDVQKLLHALREQCHPLYVPVVLAVMYGLRRGEALGIRWCDINFDTGAVFISKNYTTDGRNGVTYRKVKTKESARTIILSEGFLNDLKEIKANHERSGHIAEFVLESVVDKMPDPRGIVGKLNRFQKGNGLTVCRFHDLRHTFAALQRAAGTDLDTLKRMLGHAKIATTSEMYLSADDALKKAATCKIDELVFGSKDGKAVKVGP